MRRQSMQRQIVQLFLLKPFLLLALIVPNLVLTQKPTVKILFQSGEAKILMSVSRIDDLPAPLRGKMAYIVLAFEKWPGKENNLGIIMMDCRTPGSFWNKKDPRRDAPEIAPADSILRMAWEESCGKIK